MWSRVNPVGHARARFSVTLRLAAGDGNMANYALEAEFCQRGVQCNLLAWHAEFESFTLNFDNTALKYDSCSILAFGPMKEIIQQGPASHALAASVWPNAVRGEGTSCGFKAQSYHLVQPSAGNLGYSRTSTRPAIAEAAASGPAIAGEEGGGAAAPASHTRTRRKGPVSADVEAGEWPFVNEELFEVCSMFYDILNLGGGSMDADNRERYVNARSMLPHLFVEPRLWKQKTELAVILRSREVLADYQKADPRGNQWARGGHFPLTVALNMGAHNQRDWSDKGEQQRRIKQRKKHTWLASGTWPWWIPCGSTEKHHWVQSVKGNEVLGGQSDGLFWRYSREEFLEDDSWGTRQDRASALVEYEHAWVSANSLEAHDAALASTENAYQKAKENGVTLASLSEEADRVAEQLGKGGGKRGRKKGKGAK